MAVTPPRSWADRNKWCSLSSFSHSSPLLQSYSSVRGSLETMHLKIKSKICLLTPVVSLLQLPFFFFFSLCEKKKANIISMLLFPFLFVFECVCYFRSRLALIFCRLPLESQRWRSVCQAARRHLSPFRNNFLCTGAVAFLLQLEHWLTPFPPRGPALSCHWGQWLISGVLSINPGTLLVVQCRLGTSLQAVTSRLAFRWMPSLTFLFFSRYVQSCAKQHGYFYCKCRSTYQ